MKANQMSKMSSIQLTDRDGVKVFVDVKALEHGGETHVFMSDQAGIGSASIARNGSIYIAQLVERFDFNIDTTFFYRHVFRPANGSLFGRFELNWQDGKLLNYTFSMLNNLDDSRQLKALLEQAKPMTFSYAQIMNLAAAS